MKQNNELNIIINFLLFFGFWIFSCQSLVAKGLLLTESAVIESAKKHHPKIYITEEQIRLAEAKLQEALGAFDSKIETTYNHFTKGYYQDRSRLESKAIKPLNIANSKIYLGYNQSINGSYPELNPYFNTKSQGRTIFGLELSLLRGFLINEQLAVTKISNIDITTAKYAKLLMQSQIIADAKKAYWKYLYSKKIVELYQNMLEVALKRENSLKMQIKKGDKPRILLDENKRIILRRQSMLESAKRQLINTATNLSMYLRRDDGQMLEVEKIIDSSIANEDFNYIIPNATMLQQDTNLAKDHRFDIAIARNLLEQANIKIKLSKNQLLPIVDIGFESTTDYGEGPIEKNNNSNKVKLNITIPIENKKQRGEVNKNNANLKIARRNLHLLQDSIANEINFAYNQMKEVDILIKNAFSEIEIAKKLLTAETIKFNNGDSDFFMLNTREQDVLSAIEYHYRSKLTIAELAIEYQFMTQDTININQD